MCDVGNQSYQATRFANTVGGIRPVKLRGLTLLKCDCQLSMIEHGSRNFGNRRHENYKSSYHHRVTV